jgi:hypothetical protein
MDAVRFRGLPPKLRALVAVAVLLDGREAGAYLLTDADYGPDLAKAAEELASQAPELRMPFVGSALRAALKEWR